jgi:hypothetical protein
MDDTRLNGNRLGEELLNGPRGRGACLDLLTSAHASLGALAFTAARSPTDGELTRTLMKAIAEVDVSATGLTDDAALLDALEDSTSAARYWQPPDELDVLLSTPQLRAALEPVARRIGESASAAWWWSPVALDRQRYVQWTDESPREPPALSGAAERLALWRATALSDEREAARHSKPATANLTGNWTSTPSRMTTTSRSHPELGAVTLRLVEDGLGWRQADVWPLRPAGVCRIYEITGPLAWAELVARYPLDVSLSRRQDWWRTTGHDGSWLIPDWAAVSSDFDAVHLTVAGYLSTAGRAIAVGTSHSVLANWDPDNTYWLSDVLESAGDPVEWHREETRTRFSQWSRVIPSARS